MKAQFLTFLIALSCLTSGCTERREGLGGGGLAKTKVTVLRVDNGGEAGGAAAGGSAAMITTFGTFKGRVVVKGAVPQLTPLVREGDPAVKDAICRANTIPNETVVAGPDGGLANVFVYLRRVPKNVDVPAASETPFEMDQVGCKFVPHASIVRVGQPILLKNSDSTNHNVKAKGLSFTINRTVGPNTDAANAPVEVARKRENSPAEIVCDFHAWMRGWVLPLDHPWGTVTGGSGEFEIAGVPAGEMEFSVYHEGKPLGTYKAKISPDAPVEQIIEVDPSNLGAN